MRLIYNIRTEMNHFPCDAFFLIRCFFFLCSLLWRLLFRLAFLQFFRAWFRRFRRLERRLARAEPITEDRVERIKVTPIKIMRANGEREKSNNKHPQSQSKAAQIMDYGWFNVILILFINGRSITRRGREPEMRARCRFFLSSRFFHNYVLSVVFRVFTIFSFK